ncbi:hypothetical protein [Haladaptatus sp. NG-WS-4]
MFSLEEWFVPVVLAVWLVVPLGLGCPSSNGRTSDSLVSCVDCKQVCREMS